MKKLIIVSLVFSSLFYGCSQDGTFEDPNPSRKRIETVSTDSDLEYRFDYDDRNQVERITRLLDGSIDVVEFYTYSDGLLSEAKFVYENRSDNINFIQRNYAYGGGELLEIITTISENNQQRQTSRYHNIQRANGRFISYELGYYDEEGNELEEFEEFVELEYEANNLSQITSYNLDSLGSRFVFSSETFTYDDKKNPFRNVHSSWVFGPDFFSENNVTFYSYKSEFTEWTEESDYEYKGKWPESRVSVFTTGGNTSIVKYDYKYK